MTTKEQYIINLACHLSGYVDRAPCTKDFDNYKRWNDRLQIINEKLMMEVAKYHNPPVKIK